MAIEKKTINLDDPKYHIPKKNVEIIHSSFANFIIKYEWFTDYFIWLTKFLFKEATKDILLLIDYFMVGKSVRYLSDDFCYILVNKYELTTDEKKIVKIWKNNFLEIIRFRNNLVHGSWADGISTMTDDWSKAIIFNKKKSNTKYGQLVVDKNMINEKIQHLDTLAQSANCIQKCLFWGKESFSNYFIINAENDIEYLNDKFTERMKIYIEKRQ